VLLPAFNASAHVESAVRSVLAQTFEDFELIAVDDGSSDDTGTMLRRLAVEDGRVRLISRENRGLVSSLNEAAGVARGELLARMDADDVCEPDRFAAQVGVLLEDGGLVCVGTAVEFVDSAGVSIGAPRTLTEDAAIQGALAHGLTAICHPTAMMRAGAFRAAGGYRGETFPAEDLDLWLRMGERGRLSNLPGVGLRYRLHAGSISAASWRRQLAAMRAVCRAAWLRRGVVGQFDTRVAPGEGPGCEGPGCERSGDEGVAGSCGELLTRPEVARSPMARALLLAGERFGASEAGITRRALRGTARRAG
jgi:hypothetical protein